MGGFFGQNQLNRNFRLSPRPSIGGPITAFLDQAAFDSVHKFIATGIGNYNGTGTAPIVRHAATVNALATAANIPLSSIGFSGEAGAAFALGGMYVVGDFNGNVATSVDGDSWVAASGVGGISALQDTPNGACFDDANNKVILTTIAGVSGNQLITATPGSGVVLFSIHGPAVATGVASVACRTGSGVVLALLQGGGQIWKSTDGGATWAMVHTELFTTPIHNTYTIVWTGTQWVAFGGDNTNVLQAISTNDGATWTPAASNGMPDNPLVQIGSDGVGRLVAVLNEVSPDVYWVSNDNGSTWTNPALFTAYGDNGCRGVIWDGTQWSISFENESFSAEFFATSPDGQNFTPGPNIVNPP